VSIVTSYTAGTGAFGLPMSTNKATKPKKGTWKDWLPPGAPEPDVLLTRAQFLDRINQRGFDVSEGDIRFWEQRGILPGSVVRWDPEAKAPRAYYPYWMIAPVILLREFQLDGMSLRDIAPRLRIVAEQAIQVSKDGHDDNDQRFMRVVFFEFQKTLEEAIIAQARRFERLTGDPVNRIELIAYDKCGDTLFAVGTDMPVPQSDP
jgi:hypothetical protein